MTLNDAIAGLMAATAAGLLTAYAILAWPAVRAVLSRSRRPS